jgi:predicted kinase
VPAFDNRDQYAAPSAAPVLVIAGAPGAGKSTVADLLLHRLREDGRPVPALLDKDTVYGDFVSALLESAGRSPGEREGPWYDVHIKRFEYGGLTATAREIATRGCPVLLSGPFTQQIRNPGSWAEWVVELGGPVTLIYVRTDAATLAGRLAARDSHRDGGKRADFGAFIERMQPDVSPPVPHLEIDNRRDAALPLSSQIDRLLLSSDFPITQPNSRGSAT